MIQNIWNSICSPRIQLLGKVGDPHVIGAAINRQPGEVLIKEDLRFVGTVCSRQHHAG